MARAAQVMVVLVEIQRFRKIKNPASIRRAGFTQNDVFVSFYVNRALPSFLPPINSRL